MGEAATYSLNLKPELDVNANTTLEFIFNQDGFSKNLASLDK